MVSQKYSELNTELDGLLQGVGEKRKPRQVPVDLSELPDTIPAGTICNAIEVEKLSALKFRDLVMVRAAKGYRLRRVLRTQGEGVILAGDHYNDIAPHYHQGELLLVTEATTNGKKLELKQPADVGVYLNWLRSFVSN